MGIKSIKEGLVTLDGRVAPLWEHWAYVVPHCVFVSTAVYLALRYFSEIDIPFIPLMGVVIATVLAPLCWSIDHDFNYRDEPEVSQEVPAGARKYLAFAVMIVLYTVYIACR